MFKELSKFAAAAGLKVVKAGKDGLTAEQRDDAVADGIAYFCLHRTNFSVNERDLRSAARGLLSIASMKDCPLPITQMADVLSTVVPWVEMKILASSASTYAHLFHQGQTNPYWGDRQEIAKQACEFFKIS
jgi:hypothetical protein